MNTTTSGNFKHKNQFSNLQPNSSHSQSNSNINKYSMLMGQALKSTPQVSMKNDGNNRFSSFNIKRKDNTSKQKNNATNHSQEDISENNMIKGYKMP